MAENSSKLLLIEDSPSLAKVYQEYLRKEPYHVRHASTGADALEAIDSDIPDIMLLDLQLPDMNGRSILKQVRRKGLPTAVIVITAHGSLDVALDTMRAGAVDFLEKPFSADRLLVTLRNTARRAKLEAFVDLHRKEQFHGFIGNSLAMQAVYRIVRSAAPSKATVFITGESGSGKEVCAQAIHEESTRRGLPFVALNCASIPRELMESEVFGHVKGAFTGAVAAREGAASRADGGTLFLDEICEMDIDLQSKLLRFIQTSTFQKVGGSTQQQADIRFVCATNRDPLEEVRAGRFREDLYYRLHVVPVHLPPLREREDDILEIARHFLRVCSNEEGKHFSALHTVTEALFRRYDWPGNVRQLQNVMRNIVVLHDGEQVTPDMLPAPLDTLKVKDVELTPTSSEPTAQPTAATVEEIIPLWQVEKQTIEHAIALCEDNVPRAAALLEISPSTIYRKRQQWEAGEGTN